MAKHIFTGRGAPNFPPEAVGHHYVDTLTRDAYLSIGTSTPLDWVIAAGSSVSSDTVVDSMAGAEITKSPSVAAIKKYIEDQVIALTSQTFTVQYVTLTPQNITTSSFSLEHAPTGDVSIDVVGAGAQIKNVDFTVTGAVVTFTGLDSYLSAGDTLRVQYVRSGAASSQRFVVETITLTGSQILAAEARLANTPGTRSDVSLDVVGGSPQVRGVDYDYASGVIFWGGKGLSDIVAVGDILRITYIT